MRERPNRHDWKSCDLQGSVGSNPTSSARNRPLVVKSGTLHLISRGIHVDPADRQIALVRTGSRLGSASTSSGRSVTEWPGAMSSNDCERDVARRGPRGGSEGSLRSEARRSARSGSVPTRGQSGHALTTRPSAKRYWISCRFIASGRTRRSIAARSHRREFGSRAPRPCRAGLTEVTATRDSRLSGGYHLPSVDRDDRAGHERRDRAEQERHPAGYLVSFADAMQRDLIGQPPVSLLQVVRPGRVDRGVDRARRIALTRTPEPASSPASDWVR